MCQWEIGRYQRRIQIPIKNVIQKHYWEINTGDVLSISIEIFSSVNILCKFYAIFVVVVVVVVVTVAVGWIDGGEGCTATPEEDVIY